MPTFTAFGCEKDVPIRGRCDEYRKRLRAARERNLRTGAPIPNVPGDVELAIWGALLAAKEAVGKIASHRVSAQRHRGLTGLPFIDLDGYLLHATGELDLALNALEKWTPQVRDIHHNLKPRRRPYLGVQITDVVATAQ